MSTLASFVPWFCLGVIFALIGALFWLGIRRDREYQKRLDWHRAQLPPYSYDTAPRKRGRS